MRGAGLCCAVLPMVYLLPLGMAGTLFAIGAFLEAALGHHDVLGRLSFVQAGVHVLSLVAGGLAGLNCIVIALIAGDAWLSERPSVHSGLIAGTGLALLVALWIAIGSKSYPQPNLGLVVAPILPASFIALYRLRAQ